MLFYISGPMRGIPDFNKPAFDEAAINLRKRGYAVANPATNPPGLTPAQYMDIDLAIIRACDGIVLLKGWEKSKGCAVEVAYAKYLDIGIFEYDCVSYGAPINGLHRGDIKLNSLIRVTSDLSVKFF